MSAKRPIGIFDSGVGGLSAVRAIRESGNHYPIIYFGDTARVPYGTRDEETIISYAKQDLMYLLNKNVDYILVACGTVSAVALTILQKMTNIPIVGIVEPTAEMAASKTCNGKIAVLATEATVRSHAFSNAIHDRNQDISVIEIACPLFVPLVENAYIDKENPVSRLVAQEYLEKVKAHKADTVILGCTHFPLLKEIISDLIPETTIIDSSYEAVKMLPDSLKSYKQNAANEENDIYTSGSIEQFQKVGKIFIGDSFSLSIHHVEQSDYTNILL